MKFCLMVFCCVFYLFISGCDFSNEGMGGDNASCGNDCDELIESLARFPGVRRAGVSGVIAYIGAQGEIFPHGDGEDFGLNRIRLEVGIGGITDMYVNYAVETIPLGCSKGVCSFRGNGKGISSEFLVFKSKNGSTVYSERFGVQYEGGAFYEARTGLGNKYHVEYLYYAADGDVGRHKVVAELVSDWVDGAMHFAHMKHKN